MKNQPTRRAVLRFEAVMTSLLGQTVGGV